METVSVNFTSAPEGSEGVVKKSEKEKLFVAPVDGLYKFKWKNKKIAKRMKEGEIIDLNKPYQGGYRNENRDNNS